MGSKLGNMNFDYSIQDVWLYEVFLLVVAVHAEQLILENHAW